MCLGSFTSCNLWIFFYFFFFIAVYLPHLCGRHCCSHFDNTREFKASHLSDLPEITQNNKDGAKEIDVLFPSPLLYHGDIPFLLSGLRSCFLQEDT